MRSGVRSRNEVRLKQDLQDLQNERHFSRWRDDLDHAISKFYAFNSIFFLDIFGGICFYFPKQMKCCAVKINAVSYYYIRVSVRACPF